MSERLIAGAMSGTSADGVDVAIVAITGRGLDMIARLICHVHQAYDENLRRAIFAIREQGPVELRNLAICARDISLAYAGAVRTALGAASLEPRDLAAIAAHGQTLFHQPPNTIQWIDPALLAARTDCAVISDFRRADCAAGGQGAPLVPFADYILFRHPTEFRVMLNIGGIANVTLLPPRARFNQVIAFDTGPGNCISDWICRNRGPHGVAWDVDGEGASRGKVLYEVVRGFLQDPYFAARPPKSTDGPTMIAAFEKSFADADQQVDDLLATAAYLTALTIAQSVAHHVPSFDAIHVIASGGGTRNNAIMQRLPSLFATPPQMSTTDDLNIPSDAKEAIAFALLGAATLDNIPANIPTCTGASRPVILGAITPRP